MSTPLVDKSFEGRLKRMASDIVALQRRLTPSAAPVGPTQPINSQVTDWNNVFDVGFYWSTNAANTPTPDDAGSGVWWAGTVTVHPGSGGNLRIFQEVAEARGPQANRVWRRYYNGTTWQAWELADGIRRGTAARRAATVSRYWDFWQDTDGTQLLYVGNKSGGWRRFSGQATSPIAAWGTLQGTSPAAIVAGRTAVLTLDTVLEANEDLQVTATSVGSGYGIVSLNIVTKNATSTDISVRLMQLASATTQAFTLNWQVMQK